MKLGLGLRTDMGSANFTVFELVIHYHPSDDPEPCMFRYGLIIGLFGIGVAVGLFQK